MRHPRLKLVLAVILIFAFNFVQLAPSFADAKKNKVSVAFVGVKFENLDSDTQERVYERIHETMKNESALQLLEPKAVEQRLGAEKIAAFFAQPDSAAFRALAQELQVRFVIAGNLANQSRDPKRTLLVGELKRFDATTNLLHRFEVLKYYENFGVEVLKFKEEYVKTMLPGSDSGGSWGWLIFAGIVVAGAIALTASFVKAGGSDEGSGDGEPITP